MTLRQHLRRARRRFHRKGGNARLHTYLKFKARVGLWDKRYCAYYNVPVVRDRWVRRFITRGYAHGLVPTATTNGVHAIGSYHKRGKAADMGVRSSEVGTATQMHKLRRFQRSEYKRWHRGRSHATELIGPINNLVVLRGIHSPLAEGTDLENAHDNHVHGAKA